MHIVDARFPRLPRLAKGQATIIDDLEELDGLIVKMSIACNAKEARRYLLDETEEDLD
ncbi:MAG TPA: hypothetical protein VGT44_13515 [Ktedonobacteraceae bacterium]|nr:hypothetical protein [Chthonomonadales bacterium]HEV2581866.1 hypothetical protein [Ktedonobacteraceae bacterium]